MEQASPWETQIPSARAGGYLHFLFGSLALTLGFLQSTTI